MGSDEGQQYDQPDEFVDEIDVDEHTWQYLLFKHKHWFEDIARKHNCGVELKHSVGSDDHVQSLVRVSAQSKACLETGMEKMVTLLQVLLENDIQRRQVDLCWSENFDDLEEIESFGEMQGELKNKDVVLLLSSPCYAVGPAAALNDAESFLDAAVDEIRDVADDDFSFRILQLRLTVHVRQGMQRFVLV